MTIGYNILQPDAIDVTVRTTAVLRPIGKQEPVWQFEQRELLPANRPDPPTRIWSVPAPTQEGTYVLEVEAAWEATGAGPREGSRIGRLIRRRKPVGGASSALRRVVMVVLAPQSAKPSVALLGGETPLREAEIDSFDLSRLRGARFSAWGRSPSVSGGSAWEPPAEILAQASRHEKEREWLRGFIAKAGAEPGRLAAADERGLAWSAVSLHPALHPERPHRLTVSVAGGDPSALGALLIDPGSSDRRPKVLLDSCGVGSPAGKPGATTIEWLLWPGAAEPVLFLLNRHPTSDVTIGSVRLVELDPQPTDAKPPRADADGRGVGLHLAGRDALDRFSVSPEPGLDDPLTTAENLASYLATCGATFVVLPERLEDRPRRRRLAGRLYEDATGPDRLDLILRVLARNGVAVWIEPDLGRPDAFPELPPPDSAESIQQGLARIGATGEPDGGMYQPLHPRVREAIKRRIVEALSESGGRAGFAGVLVRLGRGPTLLGTPDTGMDDETFSRFVRETFGPEVAKEIPGLESTDPGRFEVRAKYLAGVGRMPWLTWRSKAVAGLYAELNEAARKTAPRSILALATPTLEDGPVGAEARRVDLAGLAPSQAWRSVGLDLEEWPKGPEAPVLFRGAGLSADDLARDLAVHPDLDEKLLPFSRRGVFLHAEHELVPSEGRAPLGGASGRITRPTATAPRPGTHLRSTSRRPTRSRRSTPDGSS
ncbi:hypothetical protein [Planctomyces sp. SH-PL62]|uniref:hypothetical protein n=1 Tax=Planctomyces sp. SH-PL62 TaxID=1636152 RepID=UPI00078DBA7B|nr:hypothetical protein [Planctomyces sp. SH-PL62]AMV39327.1 hypothetical protein VT85_17960 [Planctomyces sp. SH-PL62]